MAAPRFLARAGRLSATAQSGPSRLFVRANSNAAAPPSSFQPALPPSVDPAYDEALAYLAEQNALAQKRLESLKAKAKTSPSPALEQRIARLEVEAYVNDPATRRLFRETGGKGNMDQAVVRALSERAWRTEGELDLLMQRVFQLGVVPDLLPDHVPSAAVHVQLGDKIAEPGTIQPASAFANAPHVTLQLFHHPAASASAEFPEAKFTLLAIDPDSPDHENHCFVQRLHYAKADISLSVLSGETDLIHAPGTELLPYEPIAPAQGSGPHRLVFVLVRQGDGEVVTEVPRDQFDLRQYLETHGRTASDVVAATLFRTQWTKEDAEHIDAVYREHRGGPAPEYGKPPKEMKYGYPLSAKGVKAAAIRDAAWEGVFSEIEAMGMGKVPGQEEVAAAKQ